MIMKLMNPKFGKHQPFDTIKKRMASIFAFTFLLLIIFPYPNSAASSLWDALPEPGHMVGLSDTYDPVQLRGITIYPQDPLDFNFLVDTGSSLLRDLKLEEETNKLIKYFLAALTIPDEEVWVNLSPYEKDRIIPDAFGKTEMGRDLLAQDYLLKQITASLMYPENEIGKDFWEEIHLEIEKNYAEEIKENSLTHSGINLLEELNLGTIDTYNKVWVVPDKAKIFEQGTKAFILDSHLKVMLEEDYLAAKAAEHDGLADDADTEEKSQKMQLATKIIKSIIIPALEKEVNEGEHFAPLRQIYNAMILATWYKRNLNESLIGKLYINQSKTQGVETNDKEINQKIYARYIEALNKGVYNYIKEDYDFITQRVVPRKYFSGGMAIDKTDDIYEETSDFAISTRMNHIIQPSNPAAAFFDARIVLQSPDPEVTQKLQQATNNAVDTTARQEKALSYNQLKSKIKKQFISLLKNSGINIPDRDLFHLIEKMTLVQYVFPNASNTQVSQVFEQMNKSTDTAGQKNISQLIAFLYNIGNTGQITANKNYEIAYTKLMEVSQSDRQTMALYRALDADNPEQIKSRLPDNFSVLQTPLMKILYDTNILLGNSSIQNFLRLIDQIPENYPEYMQYSFSSDKDLITGEAIIELLENSEPQTGKSKRPVTRASPLNALWEKSIRTTSDLLEDVDALPDRIRIPIKFQDFLQAVYFEDIEELLSAAEDIQTLTIRLVIAKHYTFLTDTLNLSNEEAMTFINQIAEQNSILNKNAPQLKSIFIQEAQTLKNQALPPLAPPQRTEKAQKKFDTFRKGGVDFNSTFLTMETTGHKQTFNFSFDPNQINDIHLPGLTPFIVEMNLLPNQ